MIFIYQSSHADMECRRVCSLMYKVLEWQYSEYGGNHYAAVRGRGRYYQYHWKVQHRPLSPVLHIIITTAIIYIIIIAFNINSSSIFIIFIIMLDIIKFSMLISFDINIFILLIFHYHCNKSLSCPTSETPRWP